MPHLITVDDFLTLTSSGLPVIDARSPAEFEQGCFPGSLNMPLLNNEERAVVGTTYKQKGRNVAVLTGFDLVGGKFAGYIRTAEEKVPSREVIIYCWRGGMRSGILSWLLEQAGFKVQVLRGGYKSFRRWALKKLEEPRKVWVLGGMTGSGKTEALHHLRENGEQVLDLEGIARHKGSAFGALGQDKQPTNEQFENSMALQWASFDPSKPVWIENESRDIGKNKIPDPVYHLIRNSPLVEWSIPAEIRLKRILKEYAVFPVEELAACTRKIAKRLGGLRLAQSLEHLQNGHFSEWAKMMLEYYDKTYAYGLSERPGPVIMHFEAEGKDYRKETEKLLSVLNSELAIRNLQVNS